VWYALRHDHDVDRDGAVTFGHLVERDKRRREKEDGGVARVVVRETALAGGFAGAWWLYTHGGSLPW